MSLVSVFYVPLTMWTWCIQAITMHHSSNQAWISYTLCIPDKHSTHYYFIHIRFLMCIAILENMRPRHASYFSKLVYMQLCVKCSETILFNSRAMNFLLRADLLFNKWYWKRNLVPYNINLNTRWILKLALWGNMSEYIHLHQFLKQQINFIRLVHLQHIKMLPFKTPFVSCHIVSHYRNKNNRQNNAIKYFSKIEYKCNMHTKYKSFDYKYYRNLFVSDKIILLQRIISIRLSLILISMKR